MKFTAIFLLAAAMQVSARGFSQSVTLNVKDAPLEKVFKEIQKQTGYTFVYSKEDISSSEKVSLQVSNATINEVMSLCLKNVALTFSVLDKFIVIKPKPESPNENTTNVAPPVDVSGKVTDKDGKPLESASVIIKRTGKGTQTDVNGEFILKNVNVDDEIVISYTGYKTQIFKIGNRTSFALALEISDSKLDEVQIQAYGITNRRIGTGVISTVKSKDIEKQPVTNPLLALQGRVPGLNIIQNSGYAGSGVEVKIQGTSSIANGVGNDPLYVIDGVPYPSRMLGTIGIIQGSSGQSAPNVAGASAGYGNPLSFINPSDIESIDILKDADATAIYGSRAASGAIIITTKKGKAGQTKVDLNMQTGWGKMTRRLDMLNTQQFLAMRKEAYTNEGLPLPTTPGSDNYDLTVYDQNKYTNWQDVLLGGTAHYNDVHASVSGGTATTQILVGIGYHKETTVLPANFSNSKGSVHFAINNLSTNRKFRIQLSGSYLVDDNNINDQDLTQYAITLAPNAPDLYNADGSLNWMKLPNGNVTWTNPLSYFARQYNQKTDNLISSGEIGYQVLPGLDIKSSFGYTNMQTKEELLVPLTYFRPDQWSSSTRSSRFNTNNINSWIIEPQLSYKHGFGKGKFEALVGTTIHQNNSNSEYLQGSGYTSDLDLRNIAAAPTKIVRNRGISVYKYNAVFARLNYNWQEKYILDFTTRRDGSSRFGSENQFHNFGSIGAAWLFSNESFIKNNLSFLSFGKIRASYGTTGNDQIGDYRFLSLYNVVSVPTPYGGAIGTVPNSLPNAFLQWEETKKLQLSLDLTFLSDRILFNANYYRNRTSNELLSYNLPITAGFTSIARNFPATVQNYGWEFSINATNLNKRDFKWTTNLNLTFPKNKLVDFPNLATSSYKDQLVLGQPITILKLYRLLGVNSATGTYDFADKNGNATSSPNYSTDRTVLVDQAPKFYGGFQNTISFKGFELDILFQYVNQKAFNVFHGISAPPGIYFGTSDGINQPITVLQRWQKAGDNQSVQRFTTSFNYATSFNNAGTNSDMAFADASYLRLKNASLSWQVPQLWIKKAKLQNARIYVLGQNLLTKTNYVGLDPETRSSTTLPPLRVITCGINVSF